MTSIADRIRAGDPTIWDELARHRRALSLQLPGAAAVLDALVDRVRTLETERDGWLARYDTARLTAALAAAEADADRLAECADHADNCPRWIAARHAPTVYSGAGKCNCGVMEALAAHTEAVAQREVVDQ